MDNLNYKKPARSNWEEKINFLKKGKQISFYYKEERFNAQRRKNRYFVERVATKQFGKTRYISCSTDLLGIAAYLMNTEETFNTFE